MIVPVTKANEQAWAELCVALWPEITKEDMLAERTVGNLPNEFLYLINDETVAFISLSLRYDYVEGTDSSPVGYLEGIYVKPEFRGKGIGRALIEFTNEWAIAKGCTELASDCELENKDSKIFHRKMGFKEANRLICFTMDLKK